MATAKQGFRWLKQHIFEATDVLPLAAFRICFGIVMLLQFVQFREAFLKDYQFRSYFIRYDLFEWVPLLPPSFAQYFFALAILSSIGVLLGVVFRFSAVLQAVCLAFIILQEQSTYNNHYYLLWLLSLLIVFTDAHRALSLPALFDNKANAMAVGRWQILAVQLQIALVYFFGGIAKLNVDWLLHAQPIKTWLPDMLPALVPHLSQSTLAITAYAISYMGLAIDISVGFLLFTKWRWWTMGVLVSFHLLNASMFSIGYFPLFGILSLVVFFKGATIRAALSSIGYKVPHAGIATASARGLVLPFFVAWFSIQLLLPLRHWVFPGNVHWNMNGYYVSWFMKLNDNVPLLRFEVVLPGQARPYTFEVEKLSESPAQRHIIAAHPFATVKFANDVEAYLQKENGIKGDIKVYCDSYVSLNGRPLQR